MAARAAINDSRGKTSTASQPSSEEKQRRQQITRLESEVERLEQKLAQIEAALEEASASQNVEQITALGLEHTQLQDQINQRYEDWATLVETTEYDA